MPLCAVPSWLVAHKHRVLFCICARRSWSDKAGAGPATQSHIAHAPGRLLVLPTSHWVLVHCPLLSGLDSLLARIPCWGLPCQHQGALFLAQLSFHLLSSAKPWGGGEGSLPKTLSRDQTISKQPSHQSVQRQGGLEARVGVQEPGEKRRLHGHPAGMIRY